MECAACNFSYGFDHQECGECKSCNTEIFNNIIVLCDDCSLNENKCHKCEISFTNFNIDECINKLDRIKDNQISEHKFALEYRKKRNLIIKKDDNTIVDINNNYNHYCTSLKSGKFNFFNFNNIIS